MMQIIKLTDVNVDGCGTNIETVIQIEGKAELTNGIIERTKKAIEKHKEEYPDEWDTDSALNAACEYLEAEGYMCHYVIPDYEIEF